MYNHTLGASLTIPPFSWIAVIAHTLAHVKNWIPENRLLQSQFLRLPNKKLICSINDSIKILLSQLKTDYVSVVALAKSDP